MSTFRVLHTAVTSAPRALASWTAKVPTPPDAPLISTRWPGWTRPLSRRPWRAVRADTGTAAAFPNDSRAGLSASLASAAGTYSARVPSPVPNTASPGRKRVTSRPTAGRHLAGQVDAEPAAPGPAQPHLRTGQPRRPGHEIPVGRVDRRRPDPDQDLAVANPRRVDLPELEHVRRSEPVLDDRPHLSRSGGAGGRGGPGPGPRRPGPRPGRLLSGRPGGRGRSGGPAGRPGWWR